MPASKPATARASKAKLAKATLAVPFATLTDLLGKTLDDPAVAAAFALAGKVTIKPDFAIAKDAGFDFTISRPQGGSRKVLTSFFLFPEGQDKHRGFADLPTGFVWGTRAELLARRPAPPVTWKIGPGRVPASTEDPTWDQWTVHGLHLTVTYTKGSMRHINVRPAPGA